MAKRRKNRRYSDYTGIEQYERDYSTRRDRTRIPNYRRSSITRDNRIKREIKRNPYQYYKKYRAQYYRYKHSLNPLNKLNRLPIPLSFGGLWHKATRKITKCARAKSARRHQFFKSLHTGGTGRNQRVRTHRC